jgi:hypothetical protein
MDRLIEIAERVEGQVRLPSEEESKTFSDVLMDDACITSDAVADEPPKKWRILEPGEVVQEGDRVTAKTNPPSDPPDGSGWLAAQSFYFGKAASFFWGLYFARPVAEEPAKEAEPAWKPKIGDWVLVTRPKKQEINDDPFWLTEMDRFNGAVMKVAQLGESYKSAAVILAGTNYAFKVDWLAPAEPPKPPEPEYRKPVLPGDAGKWAEFSQDGSVWYRWKLCGCYRGADDREISWIAENAASIGFRHCRIKKEA